MPNEQTCPQLEPLQRLILGQLSGHEADQLEEHVSRCARCGKTIETIRAEDTLVEAIRSPADVPDDADAERIAGLIERLCSLPASAPASPAQPGTFVVARQLPELLAPAEAADEIGRLGPYRVKRILGAGGMGVVLEAEDIQLGRPVALKVMKPELAASDSARKRFLREARAAAAIEHDHIVAIYHVGEDRGVPYLVMPLLSGETLAARLHRQGKLPTDEVLRIGRQIAAGLAAAHHRGLVHRDVKPANVWLEAGSDRVKILDFGLARAAGDARLTHLGAVIGTPGYMAPEQADAEKVDYRCDLFSLGCVLYEACTGEAPFRSTGTMATLAAVATRRPTPPNELDRDVPRPLSDVVMRLLEKDPGRRFQSGGEVINALESCELPPQQPVAGPARRTWRFGISLAVAAVLILAGTIIYVKTGDGTLTVEVNQPDVKITIDAPARRVAEIRRFEGHTGIVIGVGFSPDGRYAVSGATDKTIRIWDVATGRMIHTLTGHTDQVRSVAFSPDGRRVLSGGADKTIRLWDVEKEHQIWVGTGHTDIVHAVAFSPDGRRALSGSYDKTVRVWDLEKGRLLDTLRRHTYWVRSVAFAPDGRHALSGGNDGRIILWDTNQSRAKNEFTQHSHAVTSVAFSRYGGFAVSASWDRTVRLWDLGRWCEIRRFEGHEAPLNAVAISRDGRYILSGGEDNTARLWHASTGQGLLCLQGHTSSVHGVAISPEGRYALTGSQDKTVRLWPMPPAPRANGLRK